MSGRPYTTALDPARGAMRREFSALAGLFALALNVFAGIAMAAQPVQLPGEAGASAQGRLVLCTGAGRIVMDAQGNVLPEEDGDGHPLASCVFCLPAFSAGCTGAAALSFEAPLRVPGVTLPFVSHPLAAARTTTSSHQARAPPAPTVA